MSVCQRTDFKHEFNGEDERKAVVHVLEVAISVGALVDWVLSCQ